MRTTACLVALCVILGTPLHAQGASSMFAATRNARAVVQKANATSAANIATANATTNNKVAAGSSRSAATNASRPAASVAVPASQRGMARKGRAPVDTGKAFVGSTVFGTMKGGKLDTTKVITIRREVFQYTSAGKRDPFVSLLSTSDIRPVISDLRITAIAYDAHGANSVAILRDVGTKEQYRGRVGTQIGRMRIVRIEPKAVTFMIEEFGFSRQETLAMSDTTVTRTP